ncbi:MAG: Nre family DNA repair protein [Candidatus Bathyarchaeia archaeon]
MASIKDFGDIFSKSYDKGSLCLYCKGGKMLCGKSQCPIILKAQSLIKRSYLLESELIHGTTPPGIFVGRVGYPKVYIGPLVPPFLGDTEILDTPELWLGKSIPEIVDYRYSLIRGKFLANIHDASKGGKFVELLQELAMGIKSIDSEAYFKKKPKGMIALDDDSQPFGPSAPLEYFKVSSNIKVDHRIEKAFYDRDLKASEAVISLYKSGVLVTKIQRTFSAGMLGLASNRKFVPTRWSITAVDSLVSSYLIDEIKEYNTIDEYRVYSFINLDNVFIIIFIPEKWSFEWIEAWFPGTTWNVEGTIPEMMGDYEGYYGRKTYPEVGGCYYSARLAVAEKLNAERRQATVIALREIHPGYVLPVGVWNVRESVREALKKPPVIFNDLKSVLNHISDKLRVPIRAWLLNSRLLDQALTQKKIRDFLID